MSSQINDKWIIIEPEQTKLIPTNTNAVEALIDGLYYVTEGIIDITSDVVNITKRVLWIWWQNNPQIHGYFRVPALAPAPPPIPSSPPPPHFSLSLPPPLPSYPPPPCFLGINDAAPEYAEPIIRD